jgi:uncharacterized membrane protein HdeD (DUF308 family)
LTYKPTLEYIRFNQPTGKDGDMGLSAISGLIGGILAIIAGIVVLIKPQIIAWVIGIFLIIFGISAVLAAL